MNDYRFCPACATSLSEVLVHDDGGAKSRLRCSGCGWTHWNNPTPVLAAIVELNGKLLLACNAAWEPRRYRVITGFMEAGETPEDGIRREIAEETSLHTESLQLVGVHDFQRMNQVLITYHAVVRGEVRLSPELVDYQLVAPQDVLCWRAGTGLALAEWLRSRGIEPRFPDQ